MTRQVRQDLMKAQGSVDRIIKLPNGEIKRYTFFKVSGWVGAEISYNIIRPASMVFGKALEIFGVDLSEKGPLASKIKQIKSQAGGTTVDPAAILQAIGAVAESLKFSKFQYVAEAMLDGVLVNGQPITDLDKYFQGNVAELYVAFYHGLAVNFPLRDILPMLTKSEGLEMSEAPDTQEDSAGLAIPVPPQ